MKSKNIRLEKIRRFIRDHEVGTQEEIVEHLKEEGISATQATFDQGGCSWHHGQIHKFSHSTVRQDIAFNHPNPLMVLAGQFINIGHVFQRAFDNS